MTINDQHEQDGFVGVRQDKGNASTTPSNPAVDELINRLIRAARHHQSTTQLDGLMGTSETSARRAVEDAKAAIHSAIAADITSLKAERDQLNERFYNLEKLRPHWAQGYSSDSMAAQTATSALSKLWEKLGARHQTEACQKLDRLQASETDAINRAVTVGAALADMASSRDGYAKQDAERSKECDRLRTDLTVCMKQVAGLREALTEIRDALDGEPTYHITGMGCGLEDRNITDRYDAMQHGWECAMERVYGEHVNHAKEIADKALAALPDIPALISKSLAASLDKSYEEVAKEIEAATRSSQLHAISLPDKGVEIQTLTPSRLADALDAFWNAAIGSMRDGTYHMVDNTVPTVVVNSIVAGVAAVAEELRK